MSLSVLILALGCVQPPSSAVASAPPSDAPVLAATGGGGFAELLATMDRDIAATEARVGVQPSDWTVRGQLAGMWQQRARLSGDYDDYVQADEEMAGAFEIAVEGSGPLLGRAGLSYTLHRFGEVAADLDATEARVLVDDPTQAAVTLGRANLAWQLGEYGVAEAQLGEALALDETVGGYASAAHFSWRQGDFEGASALYLESEARYHGTSPEPRAWVHLQRGLMDLERGRYDEALVHYLDADAELSGYWLVHEHIAEILVLQGELATAEAMYLDVIEYTDGPEFMDAMAELRLGVGDVAGAEAWISAARVRYEAELVRFPEASAGHALGHYLAFGPAERAVELAASNLALRDNAESRMWMAQALLAADEVEAARAEIEQALGEVWVTAELHAAAAAIYAALGEDALAEEQRESALAINPRVLD